MMNAFCMVCGDALAGPFAKNKQANGEIVWCKKCLNTHTSLFGQLKPHNGDYRYADMYDCIWWRHGYDANDTAIVAHLKTMVCQQCGRIHP
jgi:hypothetical protein